MLMFVNKVLCPFIGSLNFEIRLWEIHTFLSTVMFLFQVAVTSRYYDKHVLQEESRSSSSSPNRSHLDSLMSSQ
jgi:hypothetical protein